MTKPKEPKWGKTTRPCETCAKAVGCSRAVDRPVTCLDHSFEKQDTLSVAPEPWKMVVNCWDCLHLKYGKIKGFFVCNFKHVTMKHGVYYEDTEITDENCDFMPRIDKAFLSDIKIYGKKGKMKQASLF